MGALAFRHGPGAPTEACTYLVRVDVTVQEHPELVLAPDRQRLDLRGQPGVDAGEGAPDDRLRVVRHRNFPAGEVGKPADAAVWRRCDGERGGVQHRCHPADGRAPEQLRRAERVLLDRPEHQRVGPMMALKSQHGGRLLASGGGTSSTERPRCA